MPDQALGGVRPGPAPLSRVWTSRRVIAEDLTGDDLGDVLDLHSDAYAWWVLPKDEGYGAAEVRALAGPLGLDALAIKDLLAQDRRAKFETIGQARLVVTNAVSVDRERVEVHVHPVAVVVTERALICVAQDTPDFRPAQLFAQHSEDLAKGGVEAALQDLVRAVINTYENAVQWLEDGSDDLAAALFGEEPLDKTQQVQAFRLRTALSQVRRLTEPMRAVMDDIVASPAAPQGKKGVPSAVVARQWNLIREHHQRVAGAAGALGDTLNSILSTSLALSDLRGNDVMKKLSGWAAIIAVPTLVTGFVGQNVQFPLDGTAVGFLVYLGIMIVASLILFVVFRVKHWV